MIRRLPVIPTLIVLAAVAVMVRLGFWQIDRMHQKEALLAQYAAAQSDQRLRPLNGSGWPPLYSRVEVTCEKVLEQSVRAGQNDRGESGWAHIARCTHDNGIWAYVKLGWSKNFDPVKWGGGKVTGTLLTEGERPLVVADPPLAGLQANARPDPSNVPNNHFSYALQWFFFAGVALVIYVLALRKRLAAKDAGG
jgi:surfeit locus 1 family protein